MTKDSSLQEIDILKLLIYVVIFISLLVFFITVMIIPSIKEYKKLKVQNQISLINLGKIEQVHNAHANALADFRIKNSRTLNAIINGFDEKEFLQSTSRYFEAPSLAKLGSKSDDNASFSRYELNITAQINSPQKFYNFVDLLNNYNNIVMLDFPVRMESKGEKINTSFDLKVFKSKAKN